MRVSPDRNNKFSPIYLSVFGLGLAALCISSPASAATIVVNPGESIQAAVDAAAPKDKIIVMPGVYQETHGNPIAVRVNKDGIKLIAKSNFKKNERVILEPGPGNLHGIVAEPDPGQPDIERYMVRGFTVQGFARNGIQTEHVNKFKIISNESIDNLENGIFPILSANGLVKRNLSYGSNDSALWVEGSENVRVLSNEVHSSPTGIEVTISNNITVKKNEVHNNTTGIGLYHPSAASEPPLAGPMLNWKIEKNYIHDNNAANSAPPGSLVADLPPGGGILVLGVDDVLIKKNVIENNNFYGITTIDWCLAQAFGSFNCTDNPPDVEPVPQNVRVERNTFINNGTAPISHPLDVLATDMIHALIPGTPETGNCYEDNGDAVFADLDQGVGGTPPACS